MIDGVFPGQVVTQYVVIAELLQHDGTRCLRLATGDASGASLPWWTLEGMIGAAQQICDAAPLEIPEDGA